MTPTEVMGSSGEPSSLALVIAAIVVAGLVAPMMGLFMWILWRMARKTLLGDGNGNPGVLNHLAGAVDEVGTKVERLDDKVVVLGAKVAEMEEAVQSRPCLSKRTGDADCEHLAPEPT